MKMKNLSKALLMSTVLAASASANAHWDWNYLLGASIGYGDRSGDINTSAGSLKLDDSGFIWGFLGGVQARCNNWLFGGELHIDWHNFDETRGYASSLGSATARFERDAVIALSARAGYQVAPYLLPYIRLGVETSKDELSVTVYDGAGNFLGSGSEDKRNYRFLGGVGLEVPVPTFRGLSVRAEYNYHAKSGGISVAGLDYKPKTHSGKLSLVYNFL